MTKTNETTHSNSDTPDTRRRRFLKTTVAAGSVVGLSALGATAFAQDSGTEFELGGEVGGWMGRAPSSIEGQTNPTLELEVGQSYSITWENVDGVPHNIAILDADGNELESTEIISEQGTTQTLEFEATEAMAEYYCSVHPNSMRGAVQLDEETTATTTQMETETETETKDDTSEEGSNISIPSDHPTIQEGVDNATEGDLILIDAGTYNESVAVSTPRLTLRGVDRNEVVLDGEFELVNGVDVEGVDGVAVENLTVRHYTGNGIYWEEVDGFRGSYLTAYNNGSYGIYAYESVNGRFEQSYASGHPDSGFYLGHNNPFHAIITDVIAENNALGFSGTAAGGDLTIKDSVWRQNMAGIVPNTLDEAEIQRSIHMVNNEIHDNNNSDAPAKPLTYPALGTGILISGGSNNLVEGNDVRNHMNFGITVKELTDVPPSNNIVRENSVAESGIADLALGKPTGGGNKFLNNDASTSLPEGLIDAENGSSGDGSNGKAKSGNGKAKTGNGKAKSGGSTENGDVEEGSARVTEVYLAQGKRGQEEPIPWGDWKEAPEPEDQPTMPNPDAAPVTAEKDASVAGTEDS